MSILAHTPICDPSLKTDLGTAFEAHAKAHARDKDLAIKGIDTEWLNLFRDRAHRKKGEKLQRLTDRLMEMLRDPSALGQTFQAQFYDVVDQAGRYAYPFTWSIRSEIQGLAGITKDYTLLCFDLGMLRVLDDAALDDETMRRLISDALSLLERKAERPLHRVLPEVFEVYSEALVYQLLKERGGARLRIERIFEGDGPDFKCSLKVDPSNRNQGELSFFIEVKSVNIVDPARRLAEMLEDGLQTNIELERQLKHRKKIAIAEQVIDPNRRRDKYDPRSIRQVIDLLTEKAAGNFKAPQFRHGSTFALANILRLVVPRQGASTLAPCYYQPAMGGACVSGVLWHMAFGKVGNQIHRPPEFEGAGTLDGELTRDGFLVDPAVAMPTPGLIVLHYDDRDYRFDGLYDAKWVDQTGQWSNVETEEVFSVLCGDYNDRANEGACKYSRYRATRD